MIKSIIGFLFPRTRESFTTYWKKIGRDDDQLYTQVEEINEWDVSKTHFSKDLCDAQVIRFEDEELVAFKILKWKA